MTDKVIKFKKEFLHPDLLKSVGISGGMFYVRHLIIWSSFPVTPYEKSVNNSIVNLHYLGIKDRYEKNMKEKDYSGVMVILDKQIRMGWFIKHYKKLYKDLGEEKYFKLLRENLTYVDIHDRVRKHYNKIISIGSNPSLMMSKKEMRQFEKLPNTFVIYRGTSSDKKPSQSNVKNLLGNSWTNDKKISEWFSHNHSPKSGHSKYLIILEYQVKKSEIISYFTERNEKEIFMDYTKMDSSKVTWSFLLPKTDLDKEFD
jgi:hypothetical protein